MHLAYNSEIAARCPKCQGPGGVLTRKLFGCDEPADVPIFQRTCSACDGYGDGSCDVCGGTGIEMMFRCPASQAGITGALAVRAYQDWERGILQSAGGMADQSATLHDVLHVVKAEKQKIEEALADRSDGAGKRKG